MKRIVNVSCLILFLGMSIPTFAKVLKLRSPDTKNEVEVNTTDQISYSVKRNGDIILTKSLLSMKVGSKIWGNENHPLKITTKSFNEKADFVIPRKFNHIQDCFNQLLFQYKDYCIEFRAYNDGVAYRFVGNSTGTSTIDEENVQYNFDQNYLTYTLLTNKLQNWYEENYTIKTFSELPKDSFSLAPVMVDLKKYKVLLAESNLYNYAGMYLQPQNNGFCGVFAKYPKVEKFFDGTNKIYATEREDYIVETSLNRSFPWRVIGIFDQEQDILISELIYLLSDKPDLKSDYSWIKPGKVLWDWWNNRNIYNVDFQSGINTSTFLYMIDFAQKNGIEYLLLDEGWSAKDDLLTLNPDVDIPYICKYANEQNVGIILWAKWINVDKQLEASFDLMKSWGVKGVKIDFMDRNDAKMVNFFERVAKKADECKFLIDFHGSYPNDGMLRKYPFLITREGVLGLEYNKWSNKATPGHDVIIPYLRMWVGPMDYTPGAMLNAQAESYYSNHCEPMSKGTRCHQLAMYVIYESPLQMLSDSPTKYTDNQECFEFLKKVPVVWDETIALHGEIGNYVSMARKKGGVWYLGAMNNEKPRDIEIDLSFLDSGRWNTKIYQDGVNAETNGKDYSFRSRTISRDEKMRVHLATGGGFVAILTK